MTATLIFIIFVTGVRGEEMTVYSNIADGKAVVGIEESVTDYVTLARDPKSNLPNAFTICSSVYGEFMLSEMNFFELFTNNYTHWFDLSLEDHRDYYLSEGLQLYFQGDQERLYGYRVVPIRPKSWGHVCLGLDLETAHVRLVFNGYLLADENMENMDMDIKPSNLVDKLLGIYYYCLI